ncbi:hypothetical protein F2Q70_00018793 [Brassica cretica]|uniref:DM2 domain-containing protein n=1 Tax=Brassica cretica TaxID=69181 RepID=A0A8S9HW06_BRACR|nr:hypothetical protein F2Q70_00018793 [Brassica cretica]
MPQKSRFIFFTTPTSPSPHTSVASSLSLRRLLLLLRIKHSTSAQPLRQTHLEGITKMDDHTHIEKSQPLSRKRSRKPKRLDFVGWGSKNLIHFLESLGRDTTDKISEYDVTFIVRKYIRELTQSSKNKKKKKTKLVTCDVKLRLLFGCQKINVAKLPDLVAKHYVENQEDDEEFDYLYSSEDDDDDDDKKGRLCLSDKEVVEKEKRRGSVAAIVRDNVKLVYLRKSLVEELAKTSETFEGRVIGSFVRIKNPCQLVHVTGVKEGNPIDGYFLQVTNYCYYLKDAASSALSDDDFTQGLTKMDDHTHIEKSQPLSRKRSRKPKRLDFVGWGSKNLIHFLESLGRDTTDKISEYDVTFIVRKYIREELTQSSKNKKKKTKLVTCDVKLRLLFGCQKINVAKLPDLVAKHYVENQDDEEFDYLYSSEDDDDDKKGRLCLSDKEVVEKKPRGSVAAIVRDNVKLVYLRKSLVEELAKTSETFEGRVVGSFVRLKNPCQLVHVTGVKEGNPIDGYFLQVTNYCYYLKDAASSALSDDDFTQVVYSELYLLHFLQAL